MMRHDIYQDGASYSDFKGKKLTIKLVMVGGWIFLETPIERMTINESELRYDGIPRNLLSFVLNEHPGELVTREDLKKAGISTQRDFRQIAINAGIKKFIRSVFMPVCDKDKILLLNKANMRPAEAKSLSEDPYDDY